MIDQDTAAKLQALGPKLRNCGDRCEDAGRALVKLETAYADPVDRTAFRAPHVDEARALADELERVATELRTIVDGLS